MIELIGEAAMLEQLAEECTELAHAALKTARTIRKENPTPVTYDESMKNVREEYSDVCQCAAEFGLAPDRRQISEKNERFLQRIEEMTALRLVTMAENRKLRKAVQDITSSAYLSKNEWDKIIAIINSAVHRSVLEIE